MPESSINYKGNVSIKVKNRPSVRAHNEGTMHLFNLVNDVFSKGLIDLTTLGQRLPAYIALIYSDKSISDETLRENSSYSSYKGYSILISELPIFDKQVINGTIHYKSLLTQSLLDGSAPKVDSGYALLLDSSCENIVAFSIIDLTEVNNMRETQLGQSEIEWSMSFQNSMEENN